MNATVTTTEPTAAEIKILPDATTATLEGYRRLTESYTRSEKTALARAVAQLTATGADVVLVKAQVHIGGGHERVPGLQIWRASSSISRKGRPHPAVAERLAARKH